MGRRLVFWRIAAFDPKAICGISPSFPGLFPTKRLITYALLTRPPLMTEVMRSTCMC